MRLNFQQRIEIHSRGESGSNRMIAIEFNREHRTNITHDTVAKRTVYFFYVWKLMGHTHTHTLSLSLSLSTHTHIHTHAYIYIY